MPFIENPNASHFIIHGYSPGELRINEATYQHSVVLSPTQLQDWPPQQVNDLNNHDFDAIIQLNPELVIVGTGALHHFLDAELFTELMAKHIGFEVMNTAAACRTFDLLAAEGRNVVAALLIR